MESKEDNSVNIRNYFRLQYLVCTTASEALRQIFCEKWNTVFQSDWVNNEHNGNIFIEGPGKIVYKEGKTIQRNLLKAGNIDAWDLPLLIQSIKSLDGKKSANAENYKKFNKLKEIRNQLAHQPTLEVSDESFEKLWNEASIILASLGVSQKVFDDAKALAIEASEAPSSSSKTRSFIDNANVNAAEQLKKKGNAFFGGKKYEKAIENYSTAMMLPGIPAETLAVLFSNRSVAHLELNDFVNAKEDAKCVVQILPRWWRGYARLAYSYEKLGKHEQSIKNNEIAVKLNPPKSELDQLTESQYFCRRMMEKAARQEHLYPINFINTEQDMADDVNKRLGTSLDRYDFELPKIFNEILGISDSSPQAICAEAHKLLRGVGVPQNYEMAASRFAKASSMGSVDGMYNLAALLLEGKGVMRSTQEGINLLKKAASQEPFVCIEGKSDTLTTLKLPNSGVKESEHALGLAYYEGSGVPRDFSLAFYWWSRAVEHGNDASANNIGKMYENGEHVQQNIQQAILYMKFSALLGLERAMENLTRIYLEIIGDHFEAFNWYQLAIENKCVRLSSYEKIFADSKFLRQQKQFDSKHFLDNLRKELKKGKLKNLVIQDDQITANLSAIVKSNSSLLLRKPEDPIIIEHRMDFSNMTTYKQEGMKHIWMQRPAKLKPKLDIDVVGLKPILLKDMKKDKDHIYEGFALKLTMIEDAVIGSPSVCQIGQDDAGDIQRIYFYNIAQNKETQDVVGYGCRITIVNPYYRLCVDGKPAIRVDEPATIIYHATLTNTSRCRSCGKTKSIVPCRKCKRVFYCSKSCLENDANEMKHELVCVKRIPTI